VRIVYLTHQYFPRHTGGTEIYTRGLAERARRAGHSARVITCVESPHLDAAHHGARHTEHEGVPVTELHFNLSAAPEPALAEYDNPFTGELLRRELETVRPDLVHATHLMKLSASALEVCSQLDIPVVLTLTDYWLICPRHTLLRWNNQLCGGPSHDLDCARCLRHTHGFAAGRMQNLPAHLLRLGAGLGHLALADRLPRFWRDVRAIRRRNDYLRRAVCRAARVIALSPLLKELFVRNGYPADQIEVLQHGPEMEGLDQAATPPRSDELEVVFIGSLAYHKGPHILLEALALRPELELRLLIYGEACGSDPYLDSLRSKAAADRRVRLMGTFPPDEMGRVLASADVLAAPALWYENNPLVVQAARRVGVPVMASDLGTLASSVEHGRDGWLVPAGDARAWASALAGLTRERLPPRAPNRSVKSMDENASEIFAIYQQILSDRRCPERNTL
jgi:glycosyltransferase involved in cell wall biosynthesis